MSVANDPTPWWRTTLLAVGTALGAGVTGFLLVTVLVVELLDFEFSAIVALPIGLLFGVAVLVLVALAFGELGRIGRALAVGAAGFGYVVILLLSVRYVDLAGLRSVVSFEVLVGVAAVVAIVAFVGTVLSGGSSGRSPQ